MYKDQISRLLQQYLDAKNEGKEPYFDADDIIDMLDNFEESNDYMYFDEVLALGLKLHPYNTALKVKKCQQIIEYDGFKKGLEAIDKLAERDNQDLNLLKIDCYCALEQITDALRLVQELKDQQCEYLEDIYEYTVSMLTDMDRKKEAKDLVEEALSLFPDNMLLKDRLCYLLESRGNFSQAIEICNEIIDKDPFKFNSWYTLGRLHSCLGNFEKAVESFDYALTCEDAPTKGVVNMKFLRGYCLIMNESYDKAIDAFWDIYKDADEHLKNRILPLMAECFIKTDNHEATYTLLSEFFAKHRLEREEDGINQYINWAHSCEQTNRYDEETEILGKAVAEYPNSMQLLSLYTINLLNKGKFKLVVNLMNNCLKNPCLVGVNGEFVSLLHSGMKSLSEKSANKAIELFKKAAQFKDARPIVHTLLGIAYSLTGNNDRFFFHIKAGSLENDPSKEYDPIRGVDNEEEEEEEENEFDLKEKKESKDYIEPMQLALQYLNNSDNIN